MSRSITLSLLKFLENNGFGKIDENLFWEKLGLGRNGIYITDLGTSQERGQRRSTIYELFSRGENDIAGNLQLQNVLDFLSKSYEVCDLPAMDGYTDEGFTNVTIMPPDTISSAGEDENGRVIYSATGRVYYS